MAQIFNEKKTSLILPAYHVILISERGKKFRRRYYDDKQASLRKTYAEEFMKLPYDKIITQGQNYTILAKQHFVHEVQLILSLQLKVDNIKKCEEYLNAIIEINDMPSSGIEAEAMIQRSLDEAVAKAIDEIMDK